MKKCKLCGKKRLFLKLNNDEVCNDCIRLNEINKKNQEAEKRLFELSVKLVSLEKDIINREAKIDELRDKKNCIIESFRSEMIQEYQDEIGKKQFELNSILSTFNEKENKIYKSEEQIAKNEKYIELLKEKIGRLKNVYDAFVYSNKNYLELEKQALHVYEEEVKPTVEIHLHNRDVADLRKKFNENKKNIQELCSLYKERYTTKVNKTIYQIMVMALEAEIQNILVNLKYGKLMEGKEKVLSMTRKYLSIVSEGNQTIVNTLISFIGKIEALFLKAVEIEYEYYTKKEKIKEEQRALREQMRQEEAERKMLAEQKAQIEREEGKYKTEIENLKEIILTADEEKRTLLVNRIRELELLLSAVQNKKEEIVNLQNGKAGYVYVISNLGSFGEDIFKVGMTRRLDPQERIYELSGASVPFPFDVHTFIFSDDAVTLEHNLHLELNKNRINKVNSRKEFFKIDIEDLEKMVLKYDPSAEFRKTMLAEQFRQSLSAGDMNIIYDLVNDIEEEIYDENEFFQ